MEGAFIWHRVEDSEREEIRQQAKSLMENFSKKLEKIKTKEEFFEFGEGLREEGEPWESDSDFRNALFSNAPFVEEEQLIAEKAGWKE